MGGASTSYLLSQLGYQAPALLVYLAAIVLALVFMGRATAPCILTLIGAGILIAISFGVSVLQAFLIESQQTGRGNAAETARLLGLIGFVGSCGRAVGLGALVAAIFVDRRAAPDRANFKGSKAVHANQSDIQQ